MENLTVLIPFRDGHATIEKLLASLPADIPVIVVDDVSERTYVTDRPNVRVVRRDTRGYFAGAVNTGIAAASENDVLVLNQDVWADSGDEYIAGIRADERKRGDAIPFFKLIQAKRTEYAMIGDGVFEHPAWRAGYVQGTAMFIRHDCLSRVGGLNEKDYPLWGATAEFQLRACRAGFKALPVRMDEYGMRHARGEKPYGSSIAAALQQEPQKQNLFVRTPPRVSVIITTYKQAAYLRDAVNSLLGGETSMGSMPPQTFQDFEIVIVDDCSPDNTREIGEALADPWKAVRYLRLEHNSGSAVAANYGIKNSFGKYIALLDGDDMMAPSRLEKLVRLVEKAPHHFVYDDLSYFKNGRTFYHHRLPDYDFDVTLVKNQIHKGILFERAAWTEIGGYPEAMRYGREDWAINIALGAKGYCGIHLAEPLYLYRREGQNRSLTNTEDLGWRRFFVQQLNALYPQLYAGERPKMCCGSSKTIKSRNGNGANMKVTVTKPESSGRGARGAALVGQGGMVLLEYVRGGSSVLHYDGPVSHAKYLFGGKRQRGYVDAADVDAMLQMRKDGKPLFRRAPEMPAMPAVLSVSANTGTGTAFVSGLNSIQHEKEPVIVAAGDVEKVEVAAAETPTETESKRGTTVPPKKARPKKAAAE